MPFHIQLKLTMRLLQPIFYSILILLTTLSSCTTFKTVQNSGVLNTMAIELDDENVKYERLESKFNRRTFGGFLKGAENKNIVEATVIHNNNGSKTRATMNFFGAPGLQLTSLLTLSFGYYRGFLSDWFQSRDVEEEQIFDPYVKVLSAFAAAAFGLITNENLWRPFNGSRSEREAFHSTMKQNPDADFYSFPYAEFEVKPSLFSTRWSGTQRIVAANISDDIIPDFSASNRLETQAPQSPSNAAEDEKGAPSEQSSFETETDDSIAIHRIYNSEIEGSWPTINGKVVKIGSKGTYQTSKKRTSNVVVVNILNFQEGNPKFEIAIVIGSAYQRIIKSTDPKFTLD